jgi:hypothetical protein
MDHISGYLWVNIQVRNWLIIKHVRQPCFGTVVTEIDPTITDVLSPQPLTSGGFVGSLDLTLIATEDPPAFSSLQSRSTPSCHPHISSVRPVAVAGKILVKGSTFGGLTKLTQLQNIHEYCTAYSRFIKGVL